MSYSERFSLYISKIVDKKDILRAVSNTGIYCSNDKVGTVYLV
jgi:predicted transport protein